MEWFSVRMGKAAPIMNICANILKECDRTASDVLENNRSNIGQGAKG